MSLLFGGFYCLRCTMVVASAAHFASPLHNVAVSNVAARLASSEASVVSASLHAARFQLQAPPFLWKLRFGLHFPDPCFAVGSTSLSWN